MFQIIQTRRGEFAYQQYVAPLLQDPPPEIYADSEIDLTEPQHPGKIWWLAIVDEAVVAFAAIWPSEEYGRYECGHNYELGHRDRWQRYWPLLAAARQIWIREREYPCVTYIYEQPLAVHEALGWVRTGKHAQCDHKPGCDHHWWELTYDPS